jgi:hypothetical protein
MLAVENWGRGGSRLATKDGSPHRHRLVDVRGHPAVHCHRLGHPTWPQLSYSLYIGTPSVLIRSATSPTNPCRTRQRPGRRPVDITVNNRHLIGPGTTRHARAVEGRPGVVTGRREQRDGGSQHGVAEHQRRRRFPIHEVGASGVLLAAITDDFSTGCPPPSPTLRVSAAQSGPHVG